MACPSKIASRRNFSIDRDQPPSATRPPVRPVPAPAMVTGIDSAEARARIDATSASRSGTNSWSASPRKPDASSITGRSNLQNHRHDQRPPRGLLVEEAAKVGADFLLHDAPVATL